MSDGERFLLKDLIDEPSVQVIFRAIAGVRTEFDPDAAMAAVFDTGFSEMELKQRIRHVARVIRATLAGSYRDALDVLVRAAPAIDGAGFAAVALSDFVEEYGTDDFEASVPALAVFTRLMSAEFAVRHFIRSDQERMLAVMLDWAGDDDAALRRLASEGSRPRLPWGMGLSALKADPTPTRPILDRLRHDPSEDVRRSVANHLNDIAKDHPDYVVSVLDEWKDGSAEIEAITKHALRTLLKQGHPDALVLFGFTPGVPVDVVDVNVEPNPAVVGESTHASWTIVNRDSQPHELMVDYAVEYHRAGKSPSRKVFKGVVVSLEPGEELALRRKVNLAQMTTRRIEPGPHRVEVQVNGLVRGEAGFDVVEG